MWKKSEKNFANKVISRIDSSMTQTYYLYWIHRKAHTDMQTEGYVGITENPEQRFRDHTRKKSRSGTHLINAINRYSDIEYEVVESFSDLQTCLNRERSLRPEEGIGWNMAPGGGQPPSVTKEAAAKISQTLKERGVSPYTENTHSDAAKAKRKAAYNAHKNEWWHDPVTLEHRMIPTAVEDPPEGWNRGRKPKPIVKPKVRGVDYTCNAHDWVLIEDDETIFEGPNLKEYCVENGMGTMYANLTTAAKRGKEYRSIKLKRTFICQKKPRT